MWRRRDAFANAYANTDPNPDAATAVDQHIDFIIVQSRRLNLYFQSDPNRRPFLVLVSDLRRNGRCDGF